MTATARAKQEINPARGARAWMEVETRGISVIPVLRGLLWTASVDVYGVKHNKNRAISSLSATASTCLAAVEELISKMDDGEVGV